DLAQMGRALLVRLALAARARRADRRCGRAVRRLRVRPTEGALAADRIAALLQTRHVCLTASQMGKLGAQPLETVHAGANRSGADAPSASSLPPRSIA